MCYILIVETVLCFFTKVAILQQNQRMKQIGWCIIVAILLVACKKEEEGSCSDGLLSPGELQVDCGGVCLPCPVDNSVSEIFLVTINGVPMQFSERTLVNSPSWIMSFSNDTINVNLNFGSTVAIGAQAIEPLYSVGTLNGKVHDDLHDGLVVISEIDTVNNRLSGFFQAKLVGYFSDSLLVDTLRITNGDFESIPY